MTRPLDIAILTHSTNPRGGVVHSLELGEALLRCGHRATVFAPDPEGRGFFRKASCATVGIPAAPIGRDIRSMVETRIADYVRYFEHARHRSFDVWHAQDGISGNALATLKERGLIAAFARTVHHVDSFTDATVARLQTRAITAADRLFVVSETWRDQLARQFGKQASSIGNGVDRTRFDPQIDATDAELRDQLGLTPGAPVFLAIGGVEERKNTIRLLQAFQSLSAQQPQARLVIAGGASILDHDFYQAQFAGALAHGGASAAAVIRTGPLRQRLMPALYRAATTLTFPSIKEGFGVVVLEAMACGVPVVTSRIAPFTEYLGPDDVVWCDPYDVASIAAAMARSLEPARRAVLIANGAKVAARHDWADTARACLAGYMTLLEPAHA
jgi:glycosyltransferase-like protein